MINKVATTHCSFLRRQIKREDISTNAVSVTKTELYTILRDVCIVSRDVCIGSGIDAKLSEMEILEQPLSLPFIIENLIPGAALPLSQDLAHWSSFRALFCMPSGHRTRV
jgi:hypothetical protein